MTDQSFSLPSPLYYNPKYVRVSDDRMISDTCDEILRMLAIEWMDENKTVGSNNGTPGVARVTVHGKEFNFQGGVTCRSIVIKNVDISRWEVNKYSNGARYQYLHAGGIITYDIYQWKGYIEIPGAWTTDEANGRAEIINSIRSQVLAPPSSGGSSSPFPEIPDKAPTQEYPYFTQIAARFPPTEEEKAEIAAEKKNLLEKFLSKSIT